MATHYSTAPASERHGNGVAGIILAIVVIATLAVGAVYLVSSNNGPVQIDQGIGRPVTAALAQRVQPTALDRAPTPAKPLSNPAPQGQ